MHNLAERERLRSAQRTLERAAAALSHLKASTPEGERASEQAEARDAAARVAMAITSGSARELRRSDALGELSRFIAANDGTGASVVRSVARSAVLRASAGEGAVPAVVESWAWRRLRDAHLASTASEVLAATELGVVNAQWHLALHPLRARRLAGLVLARRQGSAGAAWSARPGLAIVRAAAMRQAGCAAELPAGVLDRALADPSALVRWHAMERTGEDEAVALEDWRFDVDERIALGAMARLVVAAGGKDGFARAEAWLAAMRRHASARVRGAAAGVERMIEAQRAVCGAERASAAQLRRALLQGDALAKLAAIEAAIRAGLVDGLVDELAEVALTGPGADGVEASLERAAAGRASSRAAMALGFAEVRGVASDRALACVERAQGRVRANAVEAIGRLGRRGLASGGASASVAELKDDAAHRVRANALRAIVGSDPARSLSWRVYDETAASGLAAMLEDGRPGHRLAGLWLAERWKWSGGRARFGKPWSRVTERVCELARSEEDAACRARAERLWSGMTAGAIGGARA